MGDLMASGDDPPEFLPEHEGIEFPFASSDDEYRRKLKGQEYKCLREQGTEAPGRGEYCGFFPDCGWDAYDKCFFTNDRCHVTGRGPTYHLEAVCSGCGSHLGHTFFGEGHTATNER